MSKDKYTVDIEAQRDQLYNAAVKLWNAHVMGPSMELVPQAEGERMFKRYVKGIWDAASKLTPSKKPTTKKPKSFIDRLYDDDTSAVNCGNSKRYKGIREPTCMGGNGCYACWDKYWERHGL